MQMHEIGLRSVNFQTRFFFVEKSHAQTGGQPSETFLLGENKMEMVDGIFLFVKKTGRDVFSIVLKLLLLLKIASNLSILFLSRTNTKPKSLMFFFFVQ